MNFLITAPDGATGPEEFGQRAAWDIRALSTHALMHSTTNAELYGRVLCGLEPNTMYI
ncbi:hypothetical protein GT034_16645 [Streptomyces sp. SID2563]|uniref:hypothetical protein n=2 Tax=unclassified Streptomyces TaxID=2593676 RepID=UPI0013F95AA4|nr:hypothetical protein [Streptomyces sp. SID2563]MYW09969.1 hypothetical protein [Streptomyces sp. SID2563]